MQVKIPVLVGPSWRRVCQVRCSSCHGKHGAVDTHSFQNDPPSEYETRARKQDEREKERAGACVKNYSAFHSTVRVCVSRSPVRCLLCWWSAGREAARWAHTWSGGSAWHPSTSTPTGTTGGGSHWWRDTHTPGPLQLNFRFLLWDQAIICRGARTRTHTPVEVFDVLSRYSGSLSLQHLSSQLSQVVALTANQLLGWDLNVTHQTTTGGALLCKATATLRSTGTREEDH